eukprot:2787078-Prymnesium_polylepis.1
MTLQLIDRLNKCAQHADPTSVLPILHCHASGIATPWSASATPVTLSHSGPESYEWTVTRKTALLT